MKRTILNAKTLGLSLILIATTFSLRAQVIYSHTITEQGYGGLKFRYKTFIKAEKEIGIGLDTESGGNEEHHHHGQQEKPQAKFVEGTDGWQEVKLEGTIPEQYNGFSLVVYPTTMGDFYVDDVIFEIQTTDNQWKTIYASGFEDGMTDWKQGVGKENMGVNPLYTSILNDSDPSEGKQCLLISGKYAFDYSDAGEHDWAIDCTYGESCSCHSICPCMAGTGEMPESCIGNNVIVIHKGHYGDVNLDGLKLMMAFSLGKWSLVYVDEHATAAQQKAILKLVWKIPMFKNFLAFEKGEVRRADIQVIATDSSYAYSVPDSYVKINYLFRGGASPLSLHGLPAQFPLSDNTLGLSEKNYHKGDEYAFDYQMRNGVVAHYKASGKDGQPKNKHQNHQ